MHRNLKLQATYVLKPYTSLSLKASIWQAVVKSQNLTTTVSSHRLSGGTSFNEIDIDVPQRGSSKDRGLSVCTCGWVDSFHYDSPESPGSERH